MSRYATLTATGRAVPPVRLTNADLEARTGWVFDDWLVRNTGIATRHTLAPDQTGSDLAVEAAREALGQAGLTPGDLDLIIVATDTPDQPSPATATVVQAKLGATRAATFDLNAACAGFVTAVDVAARRIMTDWHTSRVLVVGLYAMSRFLDWTDRRTATLFADGAGAVVLEAGDAPGYLAGVQEADGQYWRSLGIYDGGATRPATADRVSASGPPHVAFVERLPATFNLERWPALVRRVVDRADARLDDVALFVFTQLNLRTIETVMGALDQPMSKTHWVMDKWGYTGSACVPMALDDAAEQGRLSPWDLVVLCASGGGVALAASVIRWTSASTSPGRQTRRARPE